MRSLVVYTYYQSESSDYNLQYFVRKELAFRENIDYILVINGHKCPVELPDLPNLTILTRDNIGYDFGGHAHALEYIDGSSYDYYFFMNSGVIGPIVPRYLSDEFHWSTTFIRKLTGDVKLVGTTIACLPQHDAGGYGPKVEGFFFATDAIGLSCLQREKTIFCNHKTKYSAIVSGEYGLSNCIFRNGYTIDCMLNKYQGIDWLDKQNWGLNQNIHPSRYKSFYGRSIDPYEVIFHKWFWHNEPNRVSFDTVERYIDSMQLVR